MRYATDAEYRQACIERSRKKASVEPVTDGYTISFESATDRIGATIWELRTWRRLHYFPEPKHRGGRLWFTENQIQLLKKLKEFNFINRYGHWNTKREERKKLCEMIFANWQGG